MDQAEKLREMVNMQKEANGRARVITVTSGKGGVGKSNISVNLAISLSRLGKKVIILDADFGLANIEVMLGIRPVYNLADLIYHNKKLVDIITEGPEKVGFISGGSGIQELANLSKEQIVSLIENLSELDDLADIVIVDTGAGISNSVLEFVSASAEVLLITTPEPTSITDAYALLKTLNRTTDFTMKEKVIKMVANRIDTMDEGREIYNKLNVVVQKFLDIQLDYLGGIPQDPNVSKSVIRQKPVGILHPNTQFSEAINQFAHKLINSEPYHIKNKKGIAQLFSDLLKNRSKNKQ